MNARLSRQFRFANLIEQMPDPENRIVPAFDQVDAIGIPRPRIDYRIDDFALAGMEEARRICDQIFAVMGCTQVQHSEAFEGAGHVMGTYRMGPILPLQLSMQSSAATIIPISFFGQWGLSVRGYGQPYFDHCSFVTGRGGGDQE